jgi:glycosyltransferase involved in cell wall biosynthesis
MRRPGFVRRLIQTRACFRAARRGRGSAAALPPRSPKVSVMIIAYNHERYIGQALDGILMQERDFDIEINVIDDASTDRTQQVVLEYQRRHPDIIHCFFGETNLGRIATQLNTYRGFQTLRGQYFALLEGDDYWTDPKKLATQVAFLDGHPQYVACGHDTLKVYEDGSKPPEHFLPFKAFGRRRATINDLIGLAGVFHLSSLVYRNVFGTVPPLCFSDPYSCEATVNMVYGQYGDIRHLPGYMSVYRAHGTGVFSGQSVERMWLFHLHGFRRFALYMGHRYLYYFARAVCGFSAYALSAYRRGEGPRLHWRTRALFVAHLLIAKPVSMVLHPLHGVHVATRRLRSNAGDLRRRWKGVAAAPDDEYPRLLVRLLDTRAIIGATRRRLAEARGQLHASGVSPEAVPKVSVILLTHNHEQQVERALASVLQQERDFPVEINVIDDASTDGTQRIVLQSQQRHPDSIRCFFRKPSDAHTTWQLNTYRAFQTARGQYVALLDARDYWSHPFKLARQVAFLDAHPEYVACGHETLYVQQGADGHLTSAVPGQPVTGGIDELISQSVSFRLSSMVYRNLFGACPPPCFADPYSSEAAINAVYGQFGPVHGMAEAMCVHPLPASGSPAAEEQVRMWLFQLRAFQRLALYLGPRYLGTIAQAVRGFSDHVLHITTASGPALPPRIRAQFLVHRLATTMVQGGLDWLARTRGVGARVCSGMHALRAGISAPTVRGTLYRVLVLLSPHWLLRAVLTLESRWPRLHVLRRLWKHSGGVQLTNKG